MVLNPFEKIWVKLDHLPQGWGENNNSLKPPPCFSSLFRAVFKVIRTSWSVIFGNKNRGCFTSKNCSLEEGGQATTYLGVPTTPLENCIRLSSSSSLVTFVDNSSIWWRFGGVDFSKKKHPQTAFEGVQRLLNHQLIISMFQTGRGSVLFTYFVLTWYVVAHGQLVTFVSKWD